MDDMIIKQKKEIALRKICKEKGWNQSELTTGQMKFIISSLEYKKI